MRRHCYIDLEAHSELDIRSCGTYKYAEHPSTLILCLAFAFDDGPIEVVSDHADIQKVIESAVREQAVFVSHNNDAERCLLSARFGNWILDCDWLDTATLAARMGLPRSLEEMGAFFWPDDPAAQKDSVGHGVMLYLARPRKKEPVGSPTRFWTQAEKPKEFQQLLAYCIRDVAVMRRAHREKLIDLEPFERKVWQMTERMNRRGVALDMPSVKLASDYVESHESVLKAEFVKLTGCLPKSPVKVAEFFGIPDARKPTIRDALRDPRTSAEHKHGLRLLQKLAGSARSKLDAMQARVNADGRLRGALVYAGSERTLRWSSWGVQLQNMRRGLGKGTDLAFMSLALDILDLVYDGSTERPPPDPALDPLSLVGEMMRGFLIGPFKVADLAQIECRVLAWLAGQDDLLEAFRNHGDPYCDLASKIYGEAITKADKMARFLGKQATLAAGYGQGFKRFRAMLDEVYDVQIDEAFAKRVINVYRQSNQKIVALWSTLERGMLYAIESNANRVRVGPVFMGVRMIAKDKFAYIELPSRRRIWYAHPEIKVEGNHNEIRYFGRDIFRGGAWGRVSTFGGKIAENLSQATSRDLLAAAMLRLDAAGYKLNLTVHDEVVVEDDDAHSLEEFKAVFEQAPEWAAGLPLDSDCFSAYRYQK